MSEWTKKIVLRRLPRARKEEEEEEEEEDTSVVVPPGEFLGFWDSCRTLQGSLTPHLCSFPAKMYQKYSTRIPSLLLYGTYIYVSCQSIPIVYLL